MRSIRRNQPKAEKPQKPAAKRSAKPAETQKAPKLTKHISLKPRVSEKAYALSEHDNTYIFDVEPGANRFDVAAAVAAQFEVDVIGVRLAAVPGKSVRTYRQKGRRSIQGRRSAVRKAYVKLKEGENLPIFAAVEEPKAPQEAK